MDGETIFQLSNRIREYESAAAVVDALARFSTDKEAAKTLREQAEELRDHAACWLARQNREFGGPTELRRIPESTKATLRALETLGTLQALKPDLP